MTKYDRAINAIAKNIQKKNGYDWDLCLKFAKKIYLKEGRKNVNVAYNCRVS